MTTFVIYAGLYDVLVTTKKNERAYVAEFFKPEPGYRNLKDYDRREVKDIGVDVSVRIVS